MLRPDQPLAIYMRGAMREASGKMGFGVLRYSPNPIACVIDPEHAGRDAAEITGIPRSAPVVATVDEARALAAQVLVLGIAPPGGLIPEGWYADLDRAWGLGMSLVNGLHDLLSPRYLQSSPEESASRARQHPWVWDIRVEPEGLQPSQGRAVHLKARRVLMVGTDMAVGKMTAGLEIWREARDRGIAAEFVATGQIGMTVMGTGVPLDAVRVDFASGAIEREMLRVSDAELIIVEGQGSLAHPGSTATLPLLRGSMPTHLVMCARAGQETLARLPQIRIPPLLRLATLFEDLASVGGTFPRPRTVAVALNCAHLDDAEAAQACADIEMETGVPTADPVRHGAERLVDAVMA